MKANKINNNMYLQVVEQTHEEKVSMYMKCTKKQLVDMVIECNRILSLITPTVKYDKSHIKL